MGMQRLWAREIESSRHAITQNELLAQFHSLIPRHDEAGPPSPCLKTHAAPLPIPFIPVLSNSTDDKDEVGGCTRAVEPRMKVVGPTVGGT